MSIATIAMASLLACKAMSHRFECAGAIQDCSGVLSSTDPTLSTSEDSFRLAVRLPKECHIVAIYHTHPMDKEADRFSQLDLDVANHLKLPSFMMSLATDEVYVYLPAEHRQHRL